MRHRPSMMVVALMYYYAPKPAVLLDTSDAPDLQELLNAGILERNLEGGGGFRLSARGEKWIEMLLATPYPERRWTDPRQWDGDALAPSDTVPAIAVESEPQERGARET